MIAGTTDAPIPSDYQQPVRAPSRRGDAFLGRNAPGFNYCWNLASLYYAEHQTTARI